VELREVDCMFVKKLEGSATVRVELSAEDFTTIQAQLAGKQEANIKLRSEIQGVKQKVALAQVRTSWFIKKRSLLKDLWKS
jgi:RNase H-fold protein (predicted Holliday junction resolvase)